MTGSNDVTALEQQHFRTLSGNGSQMSCRPLGTITGLFWPPESVRRNERGYDCSKTRQTGTIIFRKFSKIRPLEISYYPLYMGAASPLARGPPWGGAVGLEGRLRMVPSSTLCAGRNTGYRKPPELSLT